MGRSASSAMPVKPIGAIVHATWEELDAAGALGQPHWTNGRPASRKVGWGALPALCAGACSMRPKCDRSATLQNRRTAQDSACRPQRKEVPMKNTSRLALGLAAFLVAAPAFAECPGHSSVTAQTQSTPAPVAQSTPAPASTAQPADDTVILTQNQSQSQPTAAPPQE
jgi:hypothetical protein